MAGTGPRGGYGGRAGDASLGMTVRGAARDYLNARRGTIARTSRRSFSYSIDSFIESAGGEMLVRLVRARHVERWLEERAVVVAASTRVTDLSRVRGMCRWLVTHGYMKADPTAGIARIRVPEPIARELSPEQVTKVLLACPDSRAAAVWLLMVGSGFRCIEVARAQVRDVDWNNLTILARGKNDKQRVVTLTPETADAIRAYLAEHPTSSGPLIRSLVDDRSPLGARRVSDLVGQWVRAAGIKERPYDGVSAHAGRHTYAGELLDAGADPRDVQEAMGHASMTTTARYWRRRQNIARLQKLERRTYSQPLSWPDGPTTSPPSGHDTLSRGLSDPEREQPPTRRPAA